MKRVFLWMLIIIMAASMLATFSLAGCKVEEATEEAVEEVEETAEEAVEEVEETVKEEKEEKIELTFIGWVAAEGASADAWNEMVSMFEETHPNIDIVTEAVPYGQIRKQFLIRSTAGNAPDIAQMPEHELSALVEAGALASVDDYFSEEEIADFYPSALEGTQFTFVDADENKTVEMKAVPWNPSAITLNWNKNLFKAAGLDPDTPPKTWDEMTEMARKISALGTDTEGNKIYGIGFRTDTSPGVGYWFFNTLWAYGGDFLDAEGNIVIDSEEAVEALNWYKTLADEGTMPVGIGIRDLRVMFTKNQLGMRWGTNGMIGIGRKESGLGEEWDNQWGAAPNPINKNDTPVAFTSSLTLCISEQCEYKDEALEFVKFIAMNKDATEYFYSKMGKTPSLMSLAEADAYKESPIIKAYFEALATARPQPSKNPNYLKAMDFLRIAIQKVLIEDVDTKTALSEAAKGIDVLY